MRRCLVHPAEDRAASHASRRISPESASSPRSGRIRCVPHHCRGITPSIFSRMIGSPVKQAFSFGKPFPQPSARLFPVRTDNRPLGQRRAAMPILRPPWIPQKLPLPQSAPALVNIVFDQLPPWTEAPERRMPPYAAGGAALNSLDALVKSEPVWAGGRWRGRLVMKSALSAVRAARPPRGRCRAAGRYQLCAPGRSGTGGMHFPWLAKPATGGRLSTQLWQELANLLLGPLW